MKTQTVNPIGIPLQNYFQHGNNSISLDHSKNKMKAKVIETGNKMEVLVVDDDQTYNNAIVNYLKTHLGSTAIVKSFSTGEECIDLIKRENQVIILDYFLNSRYSEAMNGISVLDVIKKRNPNAEVIMVSGQDKLEIAVSAMRHGAHNYIVKGASAFPQIFNSVRNVFHTYSMRKELKQYRRLAIGTAICIAIIVGVTILLEIIAPQIFSHL